MQENTFYILEMCCIIKKEFKSERSFKMIKIRNEAEEDYKIVEEITRKAAYGIFI